MEPADPSFSLLTFWRRWPLAVRPLLLLAALTFAAALVASIAGFLTGDDAVRPWMTPTELTAVDVPVDTVRVGTLVLPIFEPAQLVTQVLAPAPPALPLDAASWLLALLAIVLVGYLTILPGLGWRTFLVAAGAVTFLLSTFNLDLLGLLPAGAKANSLLAQATTGAAVLLLVGPAWVLHAFFPRIGPTRRLLIFGGIVLALGAALFWRSPLPLAATALHVVSYGMAGVLGASILVVLWVSFENIRALLWLTGQANAPARRRGLGAFALATGLYLLNLLLLFLDAFGFTNLGGAFLNAFFVLLSSLVSGLFGLRLREAEYGRAVSYLLMLPLYLLLSALTLGTLAYAFVTANGSLIEAFTAGVVATHLVAGVAFFVYVIYNFTNLIRRRLRTYRVVFEPKRLPLLMMYAIAAIGLVSILLREQFFLSRQLQAGYYDGLGDLYRARHEDALADVTYTRADQLVPFDEKANTNRAALAAERLEIQLEQNLLRRALGRTPSEKTYAALAATYGASQTSFFEHLKVLHEARKAFPSSPVPALLLGALYARSTSLTDSVTYYYTLAGRRASRAVRGPLFVNELAWLVQRRDDNAARNLARQVSLADSPAAQANAALVALLTGPRLPPLPYLGAEPDSLTAESFAWLTQRALRQLRAADTTAVPLLTALANRPTNTIWAPDLAELRALTWRPSQPARARAALLERAEGSDGETAGRRFRTLGQWSLADSQFAAAADFFVRAANRGDQSAYLYRVVALALAGQLDSARAALPAIFTSGDPHLTAPARRLLILLSAPVAAMTNDSLKADYVVLHAAARRGFAGPSPQLDSLTATIGRPALRGLAAAALAERALTVGDVGRAWRLTNLAPAEPALRWLRAEAALLTGRQAETARLLALPLPGGPAVTVPATRAAAPLIRTSLAATTDPRAAAWHLYLTGALAAARGQTRAATAAFAPLATRAPWLERGVLAAAEFFTQHPPRAEPLLAYNSLLAGVHYNERSPALWEAYALTAIHSGLIDFAADARAHLQELLPAAEFATFDARYTALTQARATAGGFE